MTSARLEVVVVATGLLSGGAERQLYLLLRHWHNSGRFVAVCALRSGGVFADRMRDAGITVVSPFRGGSLALARRAIRDRPQVLGWMYHGALASLFFATLARRRPVWSFRQTLGELAQESVNTRFVILMLSLLRWASTRIVYNSAAAEASHCARWFDSARSLIVHNGIDLDEFTPAVRRMRSGPVVFGMLARMHPMKGHAFFVDALSSIASPARVMFVGRGCDPQAAPIKAFARVLADRAPNVELVACGESEKVAESLGEIDFLVLPSLRGESFPNVVLEGMACGAIPIVSRVGMSAEIVAGNGLVFEAGSRDGLLDCLERATRMSDDERSQLRTHALGRAREFGVDKMAAAFQRALEMEG